MSSEASFAIRLLGYHAFIHQLCTTQAALWKGLTNQFENTGFAAKHTAVMELTVLRLTDYKDIKDYVTKFSILRDQQILTNSSNT